MNGVADVVVQCDIGSRSVVRIEVVRKAPVADTWIYYLRQDGRTTPLFADADSSRGSSVEAACVGKRNRAIVLSGEFSANALKGVVLTFRDGQQAPGRLDYAEKNRATWLLLNPNEAIVVIPTNGRGETSKLYRLYRAAAGLEKEPLAESVDRLPSTNKYEFIKLARSKAK